MTGVARGYVARVVACLAMATLFAPAAPAAVTAFEIQARTPLVPNAMGWPQYELVTGRYQGELDPDDPANRIITDLAFAPRNARGRVEYSATFALTRPREARGESGVLFYDVPNRGNAAMSFDPRGHMHVSSGWQGDLPAEAGVQYASVPVASQADGAQLTGPVLARFQDMPPGSRSLPIVAGIGTAVLPRPLPLALDTTQARLLRRASRADPGQRVPASDWAFADCTQAPFPGRPDGHFLCLKDGFDPAYAYELTYTARDPRVLGIGFAAVRDLVAFLRYAPGTPQAPNPLAGRVHHAIATGISQSGNFLRSFIHLGFNAAEDGRIVFDGVNAHIAARLLALNLRFAVPGGAAGPYEPGSEGVLWWGTHVDRARGRGAASLLDRCTASATCPKIMETFGSAELWGLRMSPDLVGIDARADIALPPNVRRYYFPGTTHGGGLGGFATARAALPATFGCALPGNPNPQGPAMRALTAALVEWVVSGKEPPASRYPLLAAGELIEPAAYAARFPKLAGVSPVDKLNTLPLYDYGSGLHAPDLTGVLEVLPPRERGQARLLVPRIDADGNEDVSGVPSVQQRVPLGTYLGWNEQAGGFDRGRGCGFQGGFVPFAATRAERRASGDPRPSLEERYATHAGFVERVERAADAMVAEGFLLPEDARAIVEEARASAVLAGR